MTYRAEDLNQAIFVSDFSGHPWLSSSSNRESIRQGRAVNSNVTLDIFPPGGFPAEEHKELIDKIINVTTGKILKELKAIVADAQKSGNDLDSYCRDTLHLQQTIPELVKRLPDNPKLLVEAVLASSAFTEALTPRELTADPLLSITKSISDHMGSKNAYSTLLEYTMVSRLAAAAIPDVNIPHDVKIQSPSKDSPNDRGYAITFPRLEDKNFVQQLQRKLMKFAEGTGIEIAIIERPPGILLKHAQPHQVMAIADKAEIDRLSRGLPEITPRY
jgi:hypothetical protein